MFDAALDRIRFIFDEFSEVLIGFSGGKDSVVVLNLALQVAEEKGRLPLPVLFIDQEAEWQGTIDIMDKVMHDHRVKPYWMQMPFVISNNASSYDRFSYCWAKENNGKHIHEQREISIKENIYGTDRFHDLFNAIVYKEFGDMTCLIGGVRCDESPKRLTSLTESKTYKHITWGKILNRAKNQYTLYPIYDWRIEDVWKAIHDNGWEYNKVYDELYRHGVPIGKMRISNLHHETRVASLLLLQEIEPETWEKVSAKIGGVNTIKHLKESSFTTPKEVPPMFSGWEEYALYLIDHLVVEEANKNKLKSIIPEKVKRYDGVAIREAFFRIIVKTIMSSDWDYTNIENFHTWAPVFNYVKYKAGSVDKRMLHHLKFFTTEQKQDLINKLNEQEKGVTEVDS